MQRTANEMTQQKKYENTINNFNNQQKLFESLSQLQLIKKDQYDSIKQLLLENHRKLNQIHQASDLSKKIKHDNVIYQENQSKQVINEYWIRKVQLSKDSNHLTKIDYLNQTRQNSLKIQSLEKLENQYLQKLETSQALQYDAANRLEKLYVLPKKQYFDQFQRLQKVQAPTKMSLREEQWNQYRNSSKQETQIQSLKKLDPYRQPLPLINGSKFMSVNSSINKLFPDNSIASGFDRGKQKKEMKSFNDHSASKLQQNKLTFKQKEDIGRIQFQKQKPNDEQTDEELYEEDEYKQQSDKDINQTQDEQNIDEQNEGNSKDKQNDEKKEEEEEEEEKEEEEENEDKLERNNKIINDENKKNAEEQEKLQVEVKASDNEEQEV